MLLFFHLKLSFSKANHKAQGIKSYVLRGHLAIQKSSENIDLEEIVDGILLEKWGSQTVNKENLSLLSKGLYMKTE